MTKNPNALQGATHVQVLDPSHLIKAPCSKKRNLDVKKRT
jgi:hypothetical protein